MARIAQKQNIRHLSLEELEKYFDKLHEKKFRAKQVYEWLWLKPVQRFEEILTREDADRSQTIRQLFEELAGE